MWASGKLSPTLKLKHEFSKFSNDPASQLLQLPSHVSHIYWGEEYEGAQYLPSLFV